MTWKETGLLIAGFIVACVVMVVSIVLIIRRAMNKSSNHDRSGDHYHESGTGFPGDGH
jgi:hypothetical protein